MFRPDADGPLDPLALDRALARTALRSRRWRRALRQGQRIDDDPYEADRWVSQQTTFSAVRGLPSSDPLREPLSRWVYRFLEERVNRAALSNVVSSYRGTELTRIESTSDRMTLEELLHAALSDEPRRSVLLDDFVANASGVAHGVRRLWERRQEIATRLALASPDALELPGTDCGRAATAWLERTQGLFEEFHVRTLGEFTTLALGADAAEGWPAHINPMTLGDWFRGTDLLAGLDLDPGPWPEPCGAASYARSLRRLGCAWVDATAPTHQPFSIANDPQGLRRRTMGALLAGLPMKSAFARRALGIGSARLDDHRRVLARVVLFDSRLAAVRVLMRQKALAGDDAVRQAFPELSTLAFGMELPDSIATVLPRLDRDDPQRFAGIFLAAVKAADLENRHDEDWYRNPRAAEELRDEAQLSPETETSEAALDEGADALSRLVGSSY